MKKLLITSTLTVAAFLSTATAAFAEPNFGTCLNPQWNLSQENYSSNAQHGVVGISSFAGTDKIYQSGSDVLQCLCTPEGKGYQTNWMKAAGFSESEIKTYQNNGWISVTTGASYGLEDAPYLAKNIEYSCQESNITPTPTGVPGPTATPAPGGRGGGESETKPSAIETLAKTGNMALIYGFLIAGAAFLIGGMVLKKFSK